MFKWWSRREKKAPLVERRTAERHPCGIKVNDRLTVSVGPSSWPAVVSDISTTGIGLVMGVRPDQAGTFPIRLRCTHNGRKYTLNAHVVRTMLLPDGNWFCGCAFTDEIKEEDIRQIL